MSTLLLLVGVLLSAQTQQTPGNSRYSQPGVSNSLAPNGATAPFAGGSGNAAANAGGAQPANTSPTSRAATIPGPLDLINSAYQTMPSTSSGTLPTGNANTPLGTSYTPAGTQTTSGLPQQTSTDISPLGRETLPRTNPPDTGTNSSVLKPTGMMRAMMARHKGSRLAGEWVTLDEVVSATSSRADQSKQIEAYWDLCSSIADYFLGLREQEEIGRLRSVFPTASAALQRAEQQLAVRVGTAERAARASQLRLASLTGRGADRLPLPADQPFCGSYETRFDQVFAGRASAEAVELNELISLRQAELQDACDAVNRTEGWLRGISPSGMGAPDEASLLRALELIALERRAFVQIARDYNRRIARYVELARPGQIASEQLIGMLIRRNPSATATRPGTSPPTDRRTQIGSDGQRTFAGGADGWTPADADGVSTAANTPPLTAQRDDFVAPASAETPPIDFGERSLLVPPR